MTNNEIDNDPALYHLLVLKKMFKVLPESIGEKLCSQLDQFLEVLMNNHQKFHSDLEKQLQDVQVLSVALQFDLEATKRERDFYKKKAGD